ncbi:MULTISPECIES: DUF1876 domain-containing protein [Streptomyces]|jgi:Domain of unknown function (DUF1876).|uniref:DUF1876 domain-containing protein n=3 Tax=Streptomyces TaxID=1883 RepID=A0A1D8G4H8_9ACTN|nr:MULTISPECIES: DUF1876 domain-containing protein [Streptomyces]AOT60324.1 hypothetical protein A4G23_03195 [Streptomyces rubrolavendulae]KAF0646122.1 hypothetical protein K701_30365 [Streptomyces fradiae ATCC 10745 = DSM 40063]OSY51230.1 hypothetical protein BG846_03124 [Streptomyces fradiae ATCC 10745 = DSM 40063]QEV13458.1 DUF1876 domain-containing protein [Streptomyces fradiae ATCC 10745 = DSM 40063]UQS31298.1 DUF1876 domain-containing protein [Streptomyces fradiae]
MHTLVGWHVDMEFQEDGNRTRAAALVRLGDGTEVRGHGQAQRHPTDSEQLRVGEEIAGARALMDIATQLLQKAHVEIDEVKGKPSRPLI